MTCRVVFTRQTLCRFVDLLIEIRERINLETTSRHDKRQPIFLFIRHDFSLSHLSVIKADGKSRHVRPPMEEEEFKDTKER
jgi:hypothetical protein